jgi:leucyl aminopeptidase
MQFSTKTLAADKLKTACLILPIDQTNKLTGVAAQVDQTTGGAVKAAVDSGDLGAKLGSIALITGAGAIARIILVRYDSENGLTQRQFAETTRQALRAVMGTAASQTVSMLQYIDVEERSTAWKIRAQIMALRELNYRADQWKSKREAANGKLAIIEFAVDKEDLEAAQAAIDQGIALADGVDLAKDLGNAPGNICTPTYLGEQAKLLVRQAKSARLKVQVFNERQIAGLKMGSFLAVAKGSDQPPRMIVLEYKGGAAKQAPIALVGKGITFDTGGISLKPGAEMDEMKFDMCGAASVLGTFKAAVKMKLPINLVGVIVTCENMPSGKAVKPGDIVTSMSGQTIEILNTDAEGRLILCDALTYVARFKPSTVIDIATLTGACVIALGAHHSGLFTQNLDLSNNLRAAGQHIGDTCWPMPLDDEYHDGLKSNFADMANIGGRAGGAITAACFLAKFAKGYEWAHLDIAGTAWKSGAAKGATGRPVPLLTQYLLDQAAQQ